MSTVIETIQIKAADVGSLEDVLGPRPEEGVTFHTITPEEAAAIAATVPEGMFTSTDSVQVEPFLPVASTEIAHIDAIDRQVDAPIERKPVDVQIWTSHIRNPG